MSEQRRSVGALGALTAGAVIGAWLLGPFPSERLVRPWAWYAVTGADWWAILEQVAGIATAVFVALIAALFNVSGTELILRTDLDSNRELRDAGIVNVVSSVFGGIPGTTR